MYEQLRNGVLESSFMGFVFFFLLVRGMLRSNGRERRKKMMGNEKRGRKKEDLMISKVELRLNGREREVLCDTIWFYSGRSAKQAL